MRLGRYEDASATFLLLFEKFPQSQHAPRAHFLAGYALLNEEENRRAIALFDDHARRFAKGEFTQDAAYWRAMAMLYDADWKEARKAHEAYIRKYPDGSYAADSRFRGAYTLFREKQYGEAIEALQSFLEEHPEDALFNEANNLLGDCHFAEGRVTEGIEAFTRSKLAGEEDHATYDYAVFRTAAGLRGLEEKEKLRTHLSAFLEQRKDSPRIPEAVGLLGSLHRSEGDVGQARQIYWQALEIYGNDPEAEAVEGILASLAKLYRGNDDADDFTRLLREKTSQASKASKTTLAARFKWARTANADDREKAELMRQIGTDTPLRELPAAILADLGDHYASAGKDKEARDSYRTILSWWPRSRARDLAWAGLGLLAAGQGKRDEALEWFDRYEDQAGDMRFLPRVVLARAAIYEEQGRVKDATAEYNRVLGMRAARGLPVVTALTRLGELHEKQGEWQLAIPYYQRVYVLYGHFAAQSARAYLRSAEAFEQLDRKQEAANTLDEMLSMESLKETPEYAEAAKKARTLPAPNRVAQEPAPEA
jgi:TolA-binding protein